MEAYFSFILVAIIIGLPWAIKFSLDIKDHGAGVVTFFGVCIFSIVSCLLAGRLIYLGIGI